MHELSITQGILDLVLEHADGHRVTGIHLVVGELASVVDDCVQFYWDIISDGTPAAGAQLQFRRVPLQFECRDCNAMFAPTGEDFTCPHCAGTNVRVATGDDLRVEFIDVETDAEMTRDDPPAATPAAFPERRSP